MILDGGTKKSRGERFSGWIVIGQRLMAGINAEFHSWRLGNLN